LFPYWLLFATSVVGALQYRFDPRKPAQGGALLLFGALIIWLLVGLRYRVGADWGQYVLILQAITESNFWEGVWNQNSDPGYSLLNWISGRFGLGIWAVNLVCAGVFVWGLVKFARRQPNPWTIFVVSTPYLVIVVAMGYTRQAVSIGFILAGIASLSGERGMLRFLIHLAFATAFHKSAVVVLPFVALSVTHRRGITIAVVLVSALALYYAFVQASVDRLLINYVEADYASQGAGVRVAMNIPPAALYLLMARRFTTNDQERKLWRNFSYAALASLAALLLTSSTTAVDRLALYIIPLQMFVLGRVPLVLGTKARENFMLTVLIVVYSAAIQYIWLNYAVNASSWVPYKFYPTADKSILGSPSSVDPGQ
jgi:hypothetical protein